MTGTITVPYNFKPRDYQLKVFQALDGIIGKPETKKKLVLLRWHRRAGKDKTSWCYMVKEAVANPGNYAYIFPTKVMAEDALWRQVDKDGFRMLDHLPAQFIKRILDDKQIIELHNGSTIKVTGFDQNVEATRGRALHGAVFSEWAFADPEVLKRLRPTIMETDGWMIVNSTPDGMNHFAAMERAAKNSPLWHVSVLQTLWPDQPNYSGLVTPEEIAVEAEMMGFTKEQIEQEFGVSYNVTATGAYYAGHLERAEQQGRIVDCLYNHTLPVYTYWDIGLSDTQVVWFAQKVGENVHWIDFFETIGAGTDEMAYELLKRGYHYALHVMPHDGNNRQHGRQVKTTEQSFRESARDIGLSGTTLVVPKTPNVNASIDAVRKRFRLYKFDRKACQAGIEHLYKYSKVWDNKRKTYIDTHRHDQHSHAADALRMEAESHRAVNGRVQNAPRSKRLREGRVF